MDQVERVILEAEDVVTPSVNSANTALGGLESKATSVHTNVTRITDQTRTSVQRLITSLEKQAETYGKSGVEKLIVQRDQLLARYAKEPQAIDAVTRSYERMIAVEQKLEKEAAAAKAAKAAEEALKKQSEAIRSFGQQVSGLIQSPLQGAQGAIGSVISTLGPLGAGLLAGGAAFAAFAATTIESAKSLAEWGIHIKDVELRTGLTAKQVSQFGFAAKAVGQDVSIFERMMRGLSQAADDTSKDGEKARATLRKMGVDLYDSATGQIKPTADILQGVAEGIQRMPNAFERNAAAMALFKRAGIEAIPVIMELKENLKLAGNGGPGQDEVDRATALAKEIALVEKQWNSFARSSKEVIVATVHVMFKLFGKAGQVFDLAAMPINAVQQVLFGSETSSTDKEMAETKGYGYGYSESRSSHRRMVSDIALNDRMVFSAKLSDKKNADLQSAEHQLSEMQSQLKTGVLPSVNEETFKQIEAQRTVIEGIKGQEKAAKELHEWKRSAEQFEKKGDEAELDAVGKIYFLRDQLLKQAEKVKAAEKDIAEVRESADKQVDAITKRGMADFNHYEMTRDRGPSTNALSKDQEKYWAGYFPAQERIEDIGVQAQRGELQRQAAKAARMTELRGGSPEDAYRIRVDLAVQLAGIESERIAKEDDANKKTVMAAQAQKDLYTNLAEAQDQLDEKRLQAQKKAEEALQRQVETIEKQAEQLFNVLFTRPKDFAKDLGNTLHAAMIKPVVESLSSATANALHPLIYGKGGNGGINSLFHPNQDPITVSNNQNTEATRQNSTSLMAVAALLAHMSGAAMPSVAGMSNISVPSISSAAPAWFPTSRGSGGITAGSIGGFDPESGEAVGGGSTSTYGGGFTLPSFGGSSGGFSLPSNIGTPPFFGGGSTSGGGGFNPGSLLSGLKGMQLGGFTRSGGFDPESGEAVSHGGVGGSITGVSGLAGMGLQTGGMMLAMNGLTGSHAGTWGGALEGTAGGAMLGFKMGGPIGAALGAAVGLGIGVGEIIAGVKSLEQTAHDDIKQVYGVDIPANSGTIKQIVEMAKSQYGGSISMAVRAPNVRQLIMLYSEATGQKNPLSSTTPYGGSLVESGGSLYQQATYQDGQAHTFASNIPTLGGIPSSSYPTQGGPNTSGGAGPTYLSLNIGSSDAAGFMTGQYVTPQFVADQQMSAQNSSYARTQQSANMQIPGLTIA